MKILLVRLSSMGDLIHTLPAVSDLARARPDVELHWLCEAGFADIARLHPFVKKVIPMRWRYWRKHLLQGAVRREIGSLKTALRGETYDWVLDSQGLLKSALFARMAGVPVTGLDKNSAREPLAAWFYQNRIAVAKGQDAVWRNRLLFARTFGYEAEGEADFGISVPQDCLKNLVFSGFAAAADGQIQAALPPQYYVALHATSRDSKLWPQQQWLALLDRLHRCDGLPVLLPWGSDDERKRAETMAAKLPFVYVCPRLSLVQAAALLQNAAAVIGVDTGLLHLADAAARPLIGIYTDSDPLKTGVQPSARSRNLGGIGENPSVDEVFSAVQQCVAAHEKPSFSGSPL